jgi:hypothetical protein
MSRPAPDSFVVVNDKIMRVSGTEPWSDSNKFLAATIGEEYYLFEGAWRAATPEEEVTWLEAEVLRLTQLIRMRETTTNHIRDTVEQYKTKVAKAKE